MSSWNLSSNWILLFLTFHPGYVQQKCHLEKSSYLLKHSIPDTKYQVLKHEKTAPPELLKTKRISAYQNNSSIKWIKSFQEEPTPHIFMLWHFYLSLVPFHNNPKSYTSQKTFSAISIYTARLITNKTRYIYLTNNNERKLLFRIYSKIYFNCCVKAMLYIFILGIISAKGRV